MEKNKNGKNENSIRVAILTRTPHGIQRESIRLELGSEKYEKFMALLREDHPKSHTRQRCAEENILWDGDAPLV
ncbi:MAG: hypothetical protein KGI06_05610 [Candidatus Micrarchaeota archaeon]|nr:hypothetical protein [Candidatus Micrarchaeota archaeon]